MRDYSPLSPTPDRTPEAHPAASRQASLEQLLHILRPPEPEETKINSRDALSNPVPCKNVDAPICRLPAASRDKVIQRIATQVIMEDDKISLINVRGRPPRTHGSSMGDHLTAFCVQTEGLTWPLPERH